MTDEQAAMIAAATALQNSEIATSVDRSANTMELADAIANLATQIYTNVREWNDGREHDELQEKVASKAARLKDRR